MKNYSDNLILEIHNDFSFSISLADRSLEIASGEIHLNLPSAYNLNVKDTTFLRQSALVQTDLGAAQRSIAVLASSDLEITLTIDQFVQWQGAFVLHWQVRNIANEAITLSGVSMPCISVSPHISTDAWTMQGVAVEWGQDFAFPLRFPFTRENYLGHTDHGEGGGIPLVYVWNQNGGVALAHLEPTQALWYMPVAAERVNVVQLSLENRETVVLAPGETFTSLQSLISYHQGDFFEPLALYREMMRLKGIAFPEMNTEDYQAAWCSWGYEFDVQPQEMLSVLPKLREMNIRWLTLDDRWFDHYGDWQPREDTFPGGEQTMKEMVAKIHAQNAYAQLWWYPLCVEDGVGEWDGFKYSTSHILEEHPDWLLLNKDGSVARNNRGLAILCPAVKEVQEYSLALTRLFIENWDFDGHKLDNIYTVPPCHNPAHRHQHANESVDVFAQLYRKIFELTRKLKPYSVTQICPCGAQITHTLIPAMDQAVTADPTSSIQIRRRIKFYKALLGPGCAVFADHVELSDGGMDFASELGTGGILATKFILAEDEAIRPRLQEWWGLDEEKETLWKKWFALYNKHMLSDGEYLNLYDLAYDKPETHVIQKGTELYYAFFTENSEEAFEGALILRGLEARAYQIMDYINETDLGTVNGPQASLTIGFKHALLIKAVPEID
ncbi:MAG: alpha-galactosidase [Anaerolineaceae bacterium]|nr:alpha-galactosidase [Anaerolineaceae bacterium]